MASSSASSSLFTPSFKPFKNSVDLHELDLQWLHPTKTHTFFDVIVIGAGPTGLRVADLVSSHGISVCCIDPSPLSPLKNNYGVWVDEFDTLGLSHCLHQKWPFSSIHINNSTSFLLPRPYARLSRHTLQTTLLSNCISNGVVFHNSIALNSDHLPPHSTVTCADGLRLRGGLVVDAGGFNSTITEYPKKPRNYAYQVAYGVLAEVESHPFELDKMVLMDWRDTHLDSDPCMHSRNMKHPTFLYAMPMSWDYIFFEETSLVGRPGMGGDEVRGRMELRMKHMGIRVREVVEEEECFIPMGGPLPLVEQGGVGVGGAGGGVHPCTGYMLVKGMEMAKVVGEECLAGVEGVSGRVWERLWPGGRRREREFYKMGMESLVGMDLRGFRGFFQAFFGLDRRFWEGFVSRRLEFGELLEMAVSLFGEASFDTKIDILTRCPVPFARMMGSIFGDMAGLAWMR